MAKLPSKFLKASQKNARNRSQGAAFEHSVQVVAARELMAVSVMPMGCRQLGAHKLIRVRTDFDLIITYHGTTAVLDAKSFHGDRLTSSMITDHQLNALELHHSRGGLAGYLIYWVEHEMVTWFDAVALRSVKNGKGVNWIDGTVLGHISEFRMASLFDAHQKRNRPIG